MAEMEFASIFDERLFHEGPPAIFTLDPAGRLRVDPERTRECGLLIPFPTGRDPGHFVLRDRVTGLKMYMLVSHTALALCQPRADVAQHADYASAVAEMRDQWTVPRPEPAEE